MQHREDTFAGDGGLDLYYQSWHPQDQARAVLVIVHGLGGHSGQFGNIVQYLVPRSYAIYGFDLRGHGRSPGQRGYINVWAEFRNDLGNFLQLVAREAGEYPCFLYGHSLGGVIVLDYVLRSPERWRGVIVTAPALGQVKAPPFKLTLGRVLSRIWPRFSLRTGFDAAAASRDQAVLDAYAQDPLRHVRGTARLVTEFFTTVTQVQAHAAALQQPLLILQGGADEITPPEGSRSFFNRVTFADKELREYPESYHEIHNDLDYPKVLADLENWLERHLEEATSPQMQFSD